MLAWEGANAGKCLGATLRQWVEGWEMGRSGELHLDKWLSLERRRWQLQPLRWGGGGDGDSDWSELLDDE